MVPTLLVLHKGQVIAWQTDAAPVGVLRPWVEKTLPGHRPGFPPQEAREPSRPGKYEPMLVKFSSLSYMNGVRASQTGSVVRKEMTSDAHAYRPVP